MRGLIDKESSKSYSKGLRDGFFCRFEVYRTAIIAIQQREDIVAQRGGIDGKARKFAFGFFKIGSNALLLRCGACRQAVLEWLPIFFL
jgi:hypothetical protein